MNTYLKIRRINRSQCQYPCGAYRETRGENNHFFVKTILILRKFVLYQKKVVTLQNKF